MSTDLGRVRILGAEAIGQPGQRRFRLFAQNTRAIAAIMWMEKEQLTSLSVALDRFLALLTAGQVLRIEVQAGGWRSPNALPTDFPATPAHEFQVGQIKLDYDERNRLFSLSAVPMQIMMEQGEEPQVFLREEDAVEVAFTQQQAQDLSITISAVVSGGRPVCPLCRTPLDGGPHACVKQNGHREILHIEREEEDEE